MQQKIHFTVVILTILFFFVLIHPAHAGIDVKKIPPSPTPTPLFNSLVHKVYTSDSARLVDSARKKIEEIGGVVLGIASKYVNKYASKAGEKVEDFVFDNTVAGLVKQYDKLSDKQKKTIQKHVCQ